MESISTGCKNTNWSENKKERHAITKHVQEKTQSLQVNKLSERRTHTTPSCLQTFLSKHCLTVSQTSLSKHTTSLLSPNLSVKTLPYCLPNLSVKTYHILTVSKPFYQNIPLPDCLQTSLSEHTTSRLSPKPVKTLPDCLQTFLSKHCPIVSKPFCQNTALLSPKRLCQNTALLSPKPRCQNIPRPYCQNVPLPVSQTSLSKHTTSLLSPNLSVKTYHFLTVSKPFCQNIPLPYCLQTFLSKHCLTVSQTSLSKHTTSLLSPKPFCSTR